MTRTARRLAFALAASLALHLLPLLPLPGEAVKNAPLAPSTASMPLTATLHPPPGLEHLRLPPSRPAAASTHAAPALAASTSGQKRAVLSSTAATSAKTTTSTTSPPSATRPTRAPGWTQAVSSHLKALQERQAFYPPAAIAAGLEGRVEVLMLLDESGQVVAARVEHSSGHALLDDAALHAVRSLRTLPADAPREAILPIVFRLKDGQR